MEHTDPEVIHRQTFNIPKSRLRGIEPPCRWASAGWCVRTGPRTTRARHKEADTRSPAPRHRAASERPRTSPAKFTAKTKNNNKHGGYEKKGTQRVRKKASHVCLAVALPTSTGQSLCTRIVASLRSIAVGLLYKIIAPNTSPKKRRPACANRAAMYHFCTTRFRSRENRDQTKPPQPPRYNKHRVLMIAIDPVPLKPRSHTDNSLFKSGRLHTGQSTPSVAEPADTLQSATSPTQHRALLNRGIKMTRSRHFSHKHPTCCPLRPLIVVDPPSGLSSQRRQNASVPKVLLMCDRSCLALGRRRGTRGAWKSFM